MTQITIISYTHRPSNPCSPNDDHKYMVPRPFFPPPETSRPVPLIQHFMTATHFGLFPIEAAHNYPRPS